MKTGNGSLIKLLEDIDFFIGFNEDELQALLDAGEWIKTTVGERIISEGEVDLFMFVLVQGKVRVILNDKVLATVETGDTFGEIGVMGGRRTAHVEAQEDCLLLRFQADDLNLLSLPLQIKVLKKILFTMFARLQRVSRRAWWNLPHTVS